MVFGDRCVVRRWPQSHHEHGVTILWGERGSRCGGGVGGSAGSLRDRGRWLDVIP